RRPGAGRDWPARSHWSANPGGSTDRLAAKGRPERQTRHQVSISPHIVSPIGDDHQLWAERDVNNGRYARSGRTVRRSLRLLTIAIVSMSRQRRSASAIVMKCLSRAISIARLRVSPLPTTSPSLVSTRYLILGDDPHRPQSARRRSLLAPTVAARRPWRNWC